MLINCAKRLRRLDSTVILSSIEPSALREPRSYENSPGHALNQFRISEESLLLIQWHLWFSLNICSFCMCRLFLPSLYDCGTHGVQLHVAGSFHDDGTLQEPAPSHAAVAVERTGLHWRFYGTQHCPQQPVTCGNHPVPQPGHKVFRRTPVVGLQMYETHRRLVAQNCLV